MSIGNGKAHLYYPRKYRVLICKSRKAGLRVRRNLYLCGRFTHTAKMDRTPARRSRAAHNAAPFFPAAGACTHQIPMRQ